jgi:hypothetical protein
METMKVGMHEFRENLASYLESGTPLAIMRHGETLGFYIPAQKRDRKAELAALRSAAADLDAIIGAWGSGEDDLVKEYKEIRRTAREKSGLRRCTRPSRPTHENDSAIAIPTIGPCSRPRWRLGVRSGRKTPTSSAAEFQLGRRYGWRSFSADLETEPAANLCRVP